MRRWSSRSLSYCASFLPAWPTQASTSRTCAPGAIRSTLVGFRSPAPATAALRCGESPEPIANTVHRTPTATAEMAPMVAH
jgi:hypothetical protein